MAKKKKAARKVAKVAKRKPTKAKATKAKATKAKPTKAKKSRTLTLKKKVQTDLAADPAKSVTADDGFREDYLRPNIASVSPRPFWLSSTRRRSPPSRPSQPLLAVSRRRRRKSARALLTADVRWLDDARGRCPILT